MAKFIELRDTEGKHHHVNPDQVAYVKKITTGTAIVFSGVAGGIHQLVVLGGLEDTLRLLDARGSKRPSPAS